MKVRSISTLAVILTVTVSVAMAWPKSKKTINLTAPTIVGSVTLQPGDYAIDWSGTAPNVQVSFGQADKVVVTVPATLEITPNQQETLTTLDTGHGTPLLVEIRLKNATLHLVQPDNNTGN
jgi:hypothetical protein